MDFAEFFEKVINSLTEPMTLTIILLCTFAVLLGLLIWVIVLSVKVGHVKGKLKEHLEDTKLAGSFCTINSMVKDEPAKECECKCEDLEPSVLPSAIVEEPEPEETVAIVEAVEGEPDPVEPESAPVEIAPIVEKKTRDTSGIMKFTLVQLTAIAEKLGTVKSWKNKTEVADAIKLVLNSEKCTKVQIIDVLSLDFVGLEASEMKGLSAKPKAELITLLKSKLLRR